MRKYAENTELGRVQKEMAEAMLERSSPDGGIYTCYIHSHANLMQMTVGEVMEWNEELDYGGTIVYDPDDYFYIKEEDDENE